MKSLKKDKARVQKPSKDKLKDVKKEKNRQMMPVVHTNVIKYKRNIRNDFKKPVKKGEKSQLNSEEQTNINKSIRNRKKIYL